MANGFTGSKDEWNRLISELEILDEKLINFKKRYKVKITKNNHGWPNRKLSWYDGLRKAINIELYENQTTCYNFSICAWIDKKNKRYWKIMHLKKGVLLSEIFSELDELLIRGKNLLDSTTFNDLELANKIQPKTQSKGILDMFIKK